MKQMVIRDASPRPHPHPQDQPWHRHRRRGLLCVASAAPLLWIAPTPAPAALQMTHWTTAASDAWIAPPRWDNGVPNNLAFGGANTYDAFIAASGPAYTVSLDTTVVVNHLVINHANARLSILNGGVLSATGSINLQAGSLRLTGGKISSTTINATIPVTATNGGGELSAVTVNGDLDLSGAGATLILSGDTTFGTAHLGGDTAVLQIADGGTLQNTVQFEPGGVGTNCYLQSLGAFTFGTSAIVRTQSSGSVNAYINSGSLTNRGLISSQVDGQSINVSPEALTNHGVVQAINSSFIFIAATNWSNASDGTIKASGGSTMTLGGTWSNSGAIQIGATDFLYMGGDFSTAGLGLTGWTNAGGIVNLTGTLDNTGQMLTLNNVTGSWNLVGGKITGGSLAYADGHSLVLTGADGELSGVTVNGDLDLSLSGALLLVSNGTTFVTAHVGNGNSELDFADGYTLTNTVQFEGDDISGIRYLAIATIATATIGPTGIVRTQTGLATDVNINNGTLINRGLISSQVTDRTINIFSDTFTNHGTVQATGGGLVRLNATEWTNASDGTLKATGGSTLSLQSAWSNSGAIQIGAGDVLNLDGDFTTPGLGLAGWSVAGGTINLVGRLDNSGQVLTLNNTTGSWNLAAGRITGGTLNFANGKALFMTSGGGELSGVTVNGDLDLTNQFAFVFLSNGTTFNTVHLAGGGSFVILDTGQTLNTTVQFEGADAISNRAFVGTVGGMWAIGATGVVRTMPGLGADAALFNGTLTNSGQILSQVVDRTINVSPDAFINHGSVQVANGGLITLGANVITNDGTLVANNGVFNADSFTNNAGIATLGGSQSWRVGATLRVNAGAVMLSGNPAGPNFGYNMAAVVTPAAGNATLTITGDAANQFQLRTITLNAPGVGGKGLILLGPAAADNGDVNSQNHFGSPGGSVAVYLGTTTDVSPDPMTPMLVLTPAPRATVEALWRSAVLEGYWALQNHLVTSVTRGVTFAPGVVTNTSKFGLVILPSVDASGRAITYLGEDITGDTNGDGKVDINDLGNVLQHLNTAPGSQAGESGFTIYTPGEGDVNGDLIVNINDLGAVLGNLNQVYSPAAALGGIGGTAPVPEPGSGAVLATIAAALLPARRRRGAHRRANLDAGGDVCD